MQKKYKQIICCLTGSVMLWGLPAAQAAEHSMAEESGQEFALDDYIVTANRIPLKKEEIAANVTVIDEAAIAQGHFSTAADILRQKITIDQDSTGSYPVINGDTRVLVLVDGRRINWDQIVTSGSKNGVNLSQINADRIEKIEIVHGPASSLYGNDAAGGVINIITRKAKGKNASIIMEIGSDGLQRKQLQAEEKLENGFSYNFQYMKEKKKDFSYKDGKTGEEKKFSRSDYENENTSLKIVQELKNGKSLTLDIDHQEHSGGYNLTMPGDGSYYYPQGHQKGEDTAVSLQYQLSPSDYFRLYHNVSTDHIFYSTGSFYDVDRKANGFDWQKSMWSNDQHTLTGGFSWYQADFVYRSQGIDRNYATRALFLEDRWKMNDEWTLTFGSRLDDHTIIRDHTTSRVTANRQINSDSNVYLSWGQFVKSPLVEDLFSNTAWFIGNPALKPETGSTITLGGNTKLDKKTSLAMSIYSSKVENAIDYDYSGAKGTAVNIARQKRQGLDLTLSRQISSLWNLNAGYSYVHIKNQADQAADYISDPNNSGPNTYRIGLQYKENKWDAAMNFQAVSGRSLQSYSDTSYLTVDLIANYQASERTKVFAKILNLTNEGYEIRGSGGSSWITPGAYHMPGRAIMIGVEQKI